MKLRWPTGLAFVTLVPGVTYTKQGETEEFPIELVAGLLAKGFTSAGNTTWHGSGEDFANYDLS